ncbi:hypothetical protein FHS59_001138 [Algoriphagus iocasae]|uniref:DUF2971 domain-containing protein n=1 Tax=Algoriphagus iocasae TaxID=1836499 RepID=A0A841MFG3_9BACT|nr:hypothetical protein [Algoriphagus iocasae]MBB6325523.1 hypothetical protein [Algoriphagus iocasae]
MSKIYKYVSIKSAIAILNSHKIRFSTPSEFKDEDINDVGLNHITFDLSRINSAYIRDWAEVCMENPEWINVFIDSNGKWNKAKIIELYYQRYIEKRYKLRVTCFSNSFNSKMCWEKYADKCKGLIFVFDKNKIFPNYNTLHLGKDNVRYVNSYSKYSLFELDKAEFLNYWIYNKLKSTYGEEQEFRFSFYNENISLASKPFSDIIFNLPSLVGIRFGEFCPKYDKDKILKLLNEYRLEVEIIE